MSTLTAKQEAFCQKYVETGNASEAYRQTYDAGGMKPTSVNRKAKELLDNGKIAARLAELREPAAKKARVTLEGHLEDLRKLRDLAKKKGQFSAAITAEVARGKASGVHVEHHRHSGSIGTYDLSKLSDDELTRLEQILGPLAHAGGDPGGEGAEGG